jgi:outer membrane receptor protein involved in Fe transport
MPCDAGAEIPGSDRQSIVLPTQNSVEYSLYAMNQHKLGERLTLKYGLRGTVFQNVGPATVYLYNNNYSLRDSLKYGSGDFYNTYYGLEPRVGAVFQLDDNSSVKASYSRTMQFLHFVSNSSAGSPLDVWMSSSPNVKPQSAHQGSAGYFRNFLDDAVEASGEVFYKYLTNVVDFKDHAELIMNRLLEGELRTGVGEAYGVELMLRKNT